MMRGSTLFLSLGLALASSGPLAGHEGHSHGTKLMGTVKAVHADTSRVELTARDGKTTSFYLTPETKYLKGAAGASRADLKPGARVVVDIKVQGEKTVATMVKLSAAPTLPKGMAPPQ